MTTRYIVGDVLDVLRTLPDGSVDLVFTSPPFLALRSYLPADHALKAKEIGSEPTPGEFIDALLDVTEELARVLAPHGSLCFELGDTYSGSGGAGGDYGDAGLRAGQLTYRQQQQVAPKDSSGPRLQDRLHTSSTGNKNRDKRPGWPLDKSMCLIPELYRLSLAYGRNPFTGRQTDPWRVRNVVRWHRPNPPVGALGDKFRPATSDVVIACKSRTRYFDLDAVRQPYTDGTLKQYKNGPTAGAGPKEDGDGGWQQEQRLTHAGAPPLDTWTIPTAPYFTPDGLLVVPSGETSHRVRVPLDGPGDDIRRTASPDCPKHGSSDHQDSSDACGERGRSSTSRSEHTGGGPVPAQLGDSLPTPSQNGQFGSDGFPRDPVATFHSKPSSKTDRALVTTIPGTPCAQTSGDIGDTQGSLALSGQDHDSAESSISVGALGDSRDTQTTPRIADTGTRPEWSSACTCSYWIELDIASESTSDYATYPPDTWKIPTQPYRGSHYATFPDALVVKPLLAMCPERVCTECGEPSRRITERSHVVDLAGGGGGAGSNASTQSDWRDAGAVRLPDRLAVDIQTLGWTDCGHDSWRAGVVLDPFAGSGTVLSVASGHGRDSIGIDLDERNAELARERVGMFLTVEWPAVVA